MANDTDTDLSGILGKLGPTPGGGLFGGCKRTPAGRATPTTVTRAFCSRRRTTCAAVARRTRTNGTR